MPIPWRRRYRRAPVTSKCSCWRQWLVTKRRSAVWWYVLSFGRTTARGLFLRRLSDGWILTVGWMLTDGWILTEGSILTEGTCRWLDADYTKSISVRVVLHKSHTRFLSLSSAILMLVPRERCRNSIKNRWVNNSDVFRDSPKGLRGKDVAIYHEPPSAGRYHYTTSRFMRSNWSGADPIHECPKNVSTTWATSTMAHELQLLTTVIIGKVAFYYNLSDHVRLLIIESFKLAYRYILSWSEACFGVSMIIACWLRCT